MGNKVLPFGLRSAPKIFSAVAEVIQWILYNIAIQTLAVATSKFSDILCTKNNYKILQLAGYIAICMLCS